MSSSEKPFDYTAGQAFFRDGFVPFSAANVSIASSPVLYGLSVYTVFAANWKPAAAGGKLLLFRLRDHYARLVNSAKIMDFNNFAAAWPYEKFEATMLELLRRNSPTDRPLAEDVLIRVTIFVDELIAGTKIHGLKHSLSAYVYPMGAILPRDGVNLCVSSWIRNPDNAIPSRAKVNGGYANASLIKNEAILNGYDDAIVLDADGHVTEGTVSNIFLVRAGSDGSGAGAADPKLITPSASSDLLEGITRSSIIQIARDLGVHVVERTVDRSELYIADEMFLCGSSARLIPVLSVDKRGVGSGASAGVAGKLTAQLAEKYRAVQLGEDEKYKEWVREV
jgi:branched-chain amino acid aminotransferase